MMTPPSLRRPIATWTFLVDLVRALTEPRADVALCDQRVAAVAVDSRHVFESWTQYGSCSGVGVPSPIRVAVFPAGPTSVPPTVP